MEFRELSDEEWAFIEPLLPPKARTGRPRVNDRRVLNGILIPPLLLRLSEQTRRELGIEEQFIYLDGWSRFQGVRDDDEVECEVINEEELLSKLQPELQHADLSNLPIHELVGVFTLRLHT